MIFSNSFSTVVKLTLSVVIVYDSVGIQCSSDGLDEVDVTAIIGGISVTVYDDISTDSRREV